MHVDGGEIKFYRVSKFFRSFFFCLKFFFEKFYPTRGGNVVGN